MKADPSQVELKHAGRVAQQRRQFYGWTIPVLHAIHLVLSTNVQNTNQTEQATCLRFSHTGPQPHGICKPN